MFNTTKWSHGDFCSNNCITSIACCTFSRVTRSVSSTNRNNEEITLLPTLLYFPFPDMQNHRSLWTYPYLKILGEFHQLFFHRTASPRLRAVRFDSISKGKQLTQPSGKLRFGMRIYMVSWVYKDRSVRRDHLLRLAFYFGVSKKQVEFAEHLCGSENLVPFQGVLFILVDSTVIQWTTQLHR